jgi:hypothetical protein
VKAQHRIQGKAVIFGDAQDLMEAVKIHRKTTTVCKILNMQNNKNRIVKI